MLLFLLTCLLACLPLRSPEPACPGEKTAVFVISQLTFSRELEEGVSAGFDLDDAVSAAGGSSGCGLADYTDPDGTPGVDNQFARVLPVLETTEAQALEPLIQAAVDDGSLLITLELGNVDAGITTPDSSDTCVDFALGRATGTPSMGTDGAMEWNQTLARDTLSPRSEAGEVAVVDGHLEASGLAVTLPVTILGHELLVTVLNGSLRFDVQEDGSVVGTLAGGLDQAELLAIAETDNIDPEVTEMVASLLDYNVDLAPNEAGTCQQLSITLQFVAVPVFLHEGA
ncbi:MAG: hypothetical protein EXR69_04265 [Myxococcales bacterium]|nr:hypothetical protein [Myxococcales bacterium]